MNAKIVWSLVGLAALIVLKEAVFTLTLGVIIGVLFSFPVGLFTYFMPRGLATVLTVLLTIGGIAGVSVVASGPLSDEYAQLESKIPAAVDRAKSWFQKQRSGVLGKITEPRAAEKPATADLLRTVFAKAGIVALQFGNFLMFLVIIIALGAFFVHEPQNYRRGFKELIPKSYEEDFEILWTQLADGLRHWVGGILVSMVLMGLFTGLGLLLIGVPNAFLLGFLTFLGTFVPYLGAIASAIPGLLIALADSTEKFFWACGLYILVHIVEGYLVQPIVMKRAVTIRPAVLLVWQIVMGVWGGILGIAVATPIYVILKKIVQYLYVEKTLGKSEQKKPRAA